MATATDRLNELEQFRDDFDSKVAAKLDARLEPEVQKLREEIQVLRDELARTRTDLAAAQSAVKSAQDTASKAATKAELSSYLPKAGGTISGALKVNGGISTGELTVGNIYGHGNQQIHMPPGDNADGIFLNWGRGGDVVVRHNLLAKGKVVADA